MRFDLLSVDLPQARRVHVLPDLKWSVFVGERVHQDQDRNRRPRLDLDPERLQLVVVGQAGAAPLRRLGDGPPGAGLVHLLPELTERLGAQQLRDVERSWAVWSTDVSLAP
jgi:hypothetical protein